MQSHQTRPLALISHLTCDFQSLLCPEVTLRNFVVRFWCFVVGGTLCCCRVMARQLVMEEKRLGNDVVGTTKVMKIVVLDVKVRATFALCLVIFPD